MRALIASPAFVTKQGADHRRAAPTVRKCIAQVWFIVTTEDDKNDRSDDQTPEDEPLISERAFWAMWIAWTIAVLFVLFGT
jgi:hypothetical protein